MIKKTKICKRCGVEKPLSEFSKDGKYFRNQCRICRNKRRRELYPFNSEKNQEVCRKYRINNLEKVKNIDNGWHRKDYKLNTEKYKIRSKMNYENIKKENPDKYRMKRKRWREENPEREKVNNKNNHYKAYQKNKTDPKYRLNNSMRIGIWYSLKKNGGSKNGRHWEDILGYTVIELKTHLEKQFVEGMSWGNYGEWEIDHWIPLSVHNFSDVNHLDFKRAWRLNNLQPLWKVDNRIKHAKLEQSFQPSLAL